MQHDTKRLTLLRREMTKRGLSGYIVPRQDEFQGEYVAAYAERLKWLTGFSGSWGTAIVTLKKAVLFVDGRYTAQVREQVKDRSWQFKHLVSEPPTHWLAGELKRGAKLGFDPMLLTVAEVRRYAKACLEVGAKLVAVKTNLIDTVWQDQPARTAEPLQAHSVKHAGQSASAKLKAIGKQLKKDRLGAAFLAEPSNVAWLLNLRGRDVPYTPVVLAYCIVHDTGKAELFVEESRLSLEVKRSLGKGLAVFEPLELEARLKKLSRKRVLVDEQTAPEFVRTVLDSAKASLVPGSEPCTLPKAQKNSVEQIGARNAQRRDGTAMARFLYWLSQEALKGKVDEGSAATKLQGFRREAGAVDLSFESIPASGPHAASPHYHLGPGPARKLRRNEIFLIDSGGQYLDGTTDITRTVIIGMPTAEMKDRFTRVLKGMIGLSQLRFPEGTTGAHVDALARQSLWQAGLDFDHGTGHGVGSYLSVHEGPARISKTGHHPLKPGMILSNEPGYYKPGHYGIRIENLVLVTEAQAIKGGERKMLGFETLTLAPIDRHLIDTKLMTRSELQWFDAYHARVVKELSPLLPKDVQAWLKMACAPL